MARGSENKRAWRSRSTAARSAAARSRRASRRWCSTSSRTWSSSAAWLATRSAAYRTDLLQYGTFLAKRHRGATEAERTDVADFLADLATGNGHPACSPATINRKAACLRSFYRHLRREELVDDDPTAALTPPSKSRKLPRVLAYAEVKRLLESVDGGDPIALRDRALLEVMYGCGLRASEVVGLEVNDVDLRRGFVRPHGKGNKERTVPLGPPGGRGGQALPARRSPGADRLAPAARSCSSTSAAAR